VNPTTTLPDLDTPDRDRAGRGRAFFELARPATLPAPALGVAAGAVAGGVAVGGAAGSEIGAGVALGMAAFAVLNAGSNALNQHCDRTGDAIDKPHRPLPSGRLSAREVVAFAAVCYAGAITLALFAAVMAGGWAFAGLFAVAVAATLAYSVPPVRTKRRWWTALPTIALARGLVLFTSGWSVAAPLTAPDPWVIGGVLTLFLLGAAATKDWSDRRGDAATGCRTLPLDYGTRGAALRIAPFFVVPWLLLPLGGYRTHIGPVALLPLALVLSAWGLVVARSLIASSCEPREGGRNHPAWVHMYAMLVAAHVGIAAVYLAS
jgi:4-hydroxybenzoate polyprenyltransferase